MVNKKVLKTMIEEEVSNQAIPLTHPQSVNNLSPRRRIGILGGSFNPPHYGHLLIAEQVGCQLELDEVWLMPTATPPHAETKTTIAARHRLEMVRLAIDSNPLFKIQTIETDRGGINFTVDTLTSLQEWHPEAEFYFIIGTDSANDLHTWRDIDRLVELVNFVGVQRPGEFPYEGDYPILWIDSPTVDFSSSSIRMRCFLEQSIRYQVPDAVRYYIDAHGLYRDSHKWGSLPW